MQRQRTASLLRRLIRLEATALAAQPPGQASVAAWPPSNGREDFPPRQQLTDQELEQRPEWWIGQQTYNRGVFDADPEFRPAWSRYHQLWAVHLYEPGTSPPLAAVWLPRQAAEFEEARRRVLALMI